MKDVDKNGTEHTIIRCGCSTLNHVAQLTFFPTKETRSGLDPCMLCLDLVTPRGTTLLERVKQAFWHVVKGDDCLYLGFEHVYTPEGAREHIEVLQRYLDDVKRWDETEKRSNGPVV